jgi:hypothetical protein
MKSVYKPRKKQRQKIVVLCRGYPWKAGGALATIRTSKKMLPFLAQPTPNDTCITAVRTLTFALARTLAPCAISHPLSTTSWYRPLSESEKPRLARERTSPNTTGTRSQLFGLLLLLLLLLLLRLRHLNGIPRPSDCGPGWGCGGTILSMKKTPARSQ